ncbi:MAG TPA: type IV toxin-antitoxin system AbiEi family antitoxin domain-containing protein [Acidimicrobiales bacterium]|nr:type IV toxin-antitoxin system AbiEi family antitoxin domain-containing protein [Acidimicrobiales bacterium]
MDFAAMDERTRALHRLGAAQHALVTRRQLGDHGWTTTQIDCAVRVGRLIVVHPGVYRLPGAPVTSFQLVKAATLASRAPASHRAATSVWGADLGPTPPREVLTSADRRIRLPGIVVHRTSTLDPGDVVRRHGIPVTNPLQTLVDLGAVATPEQVELALDSFTSRKLITVAGARAYREKLAGQGQRGVGVLDRVLTGRALGDQAPDSLLEPTMARLCRRFGLPMPAFQVWVLVDGVWRRLDFAYLDEMINLEADGYEHHGGDYERWESDLDRDAALTAAGWRVLRTSKATLTRRPAKFAGHVRDTLALRRHELGAA